MYILSVNGSPRGQDSNTGRMLQPFLAGARDAGATTDVIYVVDLDIRDCRGCFTCWTKTPGRCILQDDMKGVLEQIKKADILVLATPLYHFGMTARLKRLLERTLPLADPHIIKKGDHFSHPRREEHRMDMVLIANCGFRRGLPLHGCSGIDDESRAGIQNSLDGFAVSTSAPGRRIHRLVPRLVPGIYRSWWEQA